MHVFGLFEFLHRWLSECSCTCAGGFNLLAESINQTFEARSNVRILCHRAKSDPSFLTEWTLFLIFTCSSLESSFVDFTEVIKRFQLKSVSVINSQLFWWTNYSVMWCCLYIYISVLVKDRFYMYFVYGISSPTFSWLAALNYFLLQQSPFSFLRCRSEMRKDLLFWQKFKFLYATPASLSRVVCLRLSKQSSVTARTNFSSQVLVLPAQERFSFKVYVFSKECLILFKGKQNNTLNFKLFTQASIFGKHMESNYFKIMLSIFNRRRVTNNVQIWREIVSKFSNALKFLSNNWGRNYREAQR